ncbi:DNA repair exonuclease [Alkalibacter rhizosphaerae]|uniref:DNA repair exonuclease n=1 Tax=Alkalibacter rhizosphaerae TaxID=2815577 RepID=A0A974XL70_9FIRM|nr:DNA repair exonuclease [Alkalibacter rhizosphaerae]QSX08011.1 DNA repair exonuclease [Alkalibacter rhizosphaerae]
MNHYTFLHSADLHLGGAGASVVLPRSIRTRLRQGSWEAFARLVHICRDKNIDFLFLAGDVFDHDRIRMTDLKAMASTLASLERTRVFIAPGNHDPMEGRLSYGAVDWPENVIIFSRETWTEVEINDWLSIWGFGWKNNSLDGDRVSFDVDMNLLKTNVLLVHGDLESADSPYFPLKNHRDFLERFDYAALGHIHKPSAQTGKWIYSGAPLASSFKDRGPRGYVKGHIQKGGVFHEFEALDHIRFEEGEVTLSPDDGWEEVREGILSARMGDKTICRIRLKGVMDPDLDVEHIHRSLEGDFYHLEILDETIPDYDVERLYKENQDNIIGLFLRSMLQEDLDDPVQRMALFYGLEALLQERSL